MLTDRDMDQTLHDAGETWRAVQPVLGEPVSLAERYLHDVRSHPGVHRTWRVTAACIAVVALIAATVVLALVLQPGHAHTPTGSTPAPFRLRLHLDTTRAQADGRPIHGYVQVINNTAKPIVIHDACNGWIAVQLNSPHIHYDLINGDVGCADNHLGVGSSKVQVTVTTRYQECEQGTKPSGDSEDPNCLTSKALMPALPAGRYQAVIQTMSLSRQPALPAPITVTLTNP